VIEGVFEPHPHHGAPFTEVEDLEADDAEAVQSQIPRRLLRAYQRRGLLEPAERKEMQQWEHGGGILPRRQRAHQG